jgi:nucleoside phosphorylase
MIICAGRNETFAFATPMGVGMIESAINLTKMCLFDRPEFILFIGSCGSYGEHKVFDIIQSRGSANIELSFLQDFSYTPLDNMLKSDNSLVKNETIINSSNYITTNKNISKQFKQYNIGAENMEFYALMQVAKDFNIDIGGIFVVTNHTNQNAHDDFIKNHKKAIDILVKFLEKENIIVPQETLKT